MKRKIKKRRNSQEYNPKIETLPITITFPKPIHVQKLDLNENRSLTLQKEESVSLSYSSRPI